MELLEIFTNFHCAIEMSKHLHIAAVVIFPFVWWKGFELWRKASILFFEYAGQPILRAVASP
jgi:hypothetical protein